MPIHWTISYASAMQQRGYVHKDLQKSGSYLFLLFTFLDIAVKFEGDPNDGFLLQQWTLIKKTISAIIL